MEAGKTYVKEVIKMSLKKLIALGCALVLAVAALAACGGNEDLPTEEPTTETVEVQTEEVTTEEVTEEATEETTEETTGEVVATDAE